MGHWIRQFLCAACMGLAALISALPASAQINTQTEARALFEQAKAYHDGIGVTQDFAQARALYTRAADQGSTDAKLNLGYLYFVGQGVARDYTLARQWYEQAANAGDESALQNLAYMDAQGLGLTARAPVATKPILIKPASTPWIKPPATALPSAAAVSEKPAVIYVPNAPLWPTARRDYREIDTVAATPPASVQTTTPQAAPTQFSMLTVLSGITMLAAIIAALAGWAADRQAVQHRRDVRELARQFFEHNRRLLREVYVRYPAEMRDIGARESGWAVAISVLIVRFVIAHSRRLDGSALGREHFDDTLPDDPLPPALPKTLSARILSAVKTHPSKARHIAYTLVPDIMTLVQSDLRAFDIEQATRAEAPPIFKSERKNPRRLVFKPTLVSAS